MQQAGCTLGLLPPGLVPFLTQVLQQQHHHHDTPTSSADEAPLLRKAMMKSPLAKHDQASAAGPSDSEDACDSAGAPGCVVDSRPSQAAALPGTLPALPLPGCPAATLPPVPALPRAQGPEPWLSGLFTASLFEHHGCRCHPGCVKNGAVKKNENNQYCLECTHAHGAGMCKLCLPAHAASCPGRVFQIRKYMYQTCVHVDDIQPLYDVSGVQAYCINSRRAVLIHPKNVEKEQKCPAFDHACLGCQRPLRHDCTYCSLRCKVDVEFGFAPITPKGSLAMRDGSGSGAVAAAAAAAAAAVVFSVPPSARPQGGSRLAAAGIKRPPPYAGAAAAAAAAALAAPSLLDVSHATRCSSGGEPAGSSRSKRRKGNLPERSHIS